MRRLAELGVEELAGRLAGRGLGLDFGVVRARIRSNQRGLAVGLHMLYGDFPDISATGIFLITADLRLRARLNRMFRPQLHFMVDGEIPFEPFPATNHLPLLEWGLNWYIANRCNHYLLLHAGVVDCGGRAIILPAQPGSGKSTLTAALTARGYRLLSDEFGVIDLERSSCLPLVRPIALKNESISVIASFAPEARMGPSFSNTRKGTVAHLAPSRASIDRRNEGSEPTLIIFPRYVPDADLRLDPVPTSRAFVKLVGNAFNYEVLGPAAFDAVARLLKRCECFKLSYSGLEEAVATISRLHGAERETPMHGFGVSRAAAI